MKNENIGIYSILNKINNKRYIGQSKNIKHRFYEHRLELNNKTHHNLFLQRAWDKYGENNFEFNIIENCAIHNLNEREIYWISYYDTQNKNSGYNLTKGGDGVIGYQFSEEDKEKMSLSIWNQKPIVKLDMDGNYICEYRNLNHFIYSEDNIYNYSYTNIKNCITKSKNQKSAYGYIWVTKEEYESENFDISYYKNATHRSKSVLQFTQDGVLIREWNSANSAGISLGINPSMITATCNGKYITCKNYIFVWKYEPEKYYETLNQIINNKKSKPKRKDNNYAQYDLNDNLIKIWSTKELKENDYSRKQIWSCAVGKQKLYKGYKWKFAT